MEIRSSEALRDAKPIAAEKNVSDINANARAAVDSRTGEAVGGCVSEAHTESTSLPSPRQGAHNFPAGKDLPAGADTDPAGNAIGTSVPSQGEAPMVSMTDEAARALDNGARGNGNGKRTNADLTGALGAIRRAVEAVSGDDKLDAHRAYALAILMALWAHADVQGFAWPGRKALRKYTGLSDDSLKRGTVRLQELGILDEVEPGKGRVPTEYRIAPAYRVLTPKDDGGVSAHSGQGIRSQRTGVSAHSGPNINQRTLTREQVRRDVEADPEPTTGDLPPLKSLTTKSPRIIAYEPIDLELANALQTAIQGCDPDIILAGGLEKHAPHFRLLREKGAPGSKNGISEKRVRDVIGYLGEPGNWWASTRNILSGKTFREKFIRLEGNMRTDRVKAGERNSNGTKGRAPALPVGAVLFTFDFPGVGPVPAAYEVTSDTPLRVRARRLDNNGGWVSETDLPIIEQAVADARRRAAEGAVHV